METKLTKANFKGVEGPFFQGKRVHRTGAFPEDEPQQKSGRQEQQSPEPMAEILFDRGRLNGSGNFRHIAQGRGQFPDLE